MKTKIVGILTMIDTNPPGVVRIEMGEFSIAVKLADFSDKGREEFFLKAAPMFLKKVQLTLFQHGRVVNANMVLAGENDDG